MVEYILQFDGGSRGNPGPSAGGAVIYKNDLSNTNEIWTGFKYVGDNKTNNYAEYYGLIIGLESAINLNINNLLVQGDSLLIINQVTKKWQVKSDSLKILYNIVNKLLTNFEHIRFEHIRRQYNKRSDSLVNQCLDNM